MISSSRNSHNLKTQSNVPTRNIQGRAFLFQMHHGNDEEESRFDHDDNNVTKVQQKDYNDKNENQTL